MSIYQGALWTRTFAFKQADKVTPVDITGWEFRAQFRDHPDDAAALVELTTANSGIAVLDGPLGRVTLTLTELQTPSLPRGVIHFDVIRTTPEPAPVWLFGAKIKVKKPVTRDA